jgi:hypothetical protein
MKDLNREQCVKLVRDLAYTRIGDDSTYPCKYTDQLEMGDYEQFRTDFVFDVLIYDLGADLITEFAHKHFYKDEIIKEIEWVADEIIHEYESRKYYKPSTIKKIINDGLAKIYGDIQDALGIDDGGYFDYYVDPCNQFEIIEQTIYETVEQILSDMGMTAKE